MDRSPRVLPQRPAWTGDVGGDETGLRHSSERTELSTPNLKWRSLRRILSTPHLLDESFQIVRRAKQSDATPDLLRIKQTCCRCLCHHTSTTFIGLRRNIRPALGNSLASACPGHQAHYKNTELYAKQSDLQGLSLPARGNLHLSLPWKSFEGWRPRQKGYVVYCTGLMVDVGPEAECLSTIDTRLD